MFFLMQKSLIILTLLLSFTVQQTIDPNSIPKFTTNISTHLPAFKPIINTTTFHHSYTIIMKEVQQQLLPEGYPPSTIYAYGGPAYNPITGEDLGNVFSFPGPSFILSKGKPAITMWQNHFTGKHMFAIQKKLNYMKPVKDFDNFIPTIVHAHGMANPSETDGIPEGWFTSQGEVGGDYFSQLPTQKNKSIAIWSNEQQESTLFYHDHSIAMTRLNVYAGLTGILILEDKNSHLSTIFDSKHDISLMITDKTFNKDGSLYYPDEAESKEFQVWVPEFYAETILVNGKVWPNMNVEKNHYRVRIVNSCNGRQLLLSFFDEEAKEDIPFQLYKADSCYYNNPLTLTKVEVPPAARVELVIDFALVKGKRIIVKNTLPQQATEQEKENYKEETVGVVMSITPCLPVHKKIEIPVLNNLNPNLHEFPMFAPSITNRYVTFYEVTDKQDEPIGVFIDGVRMHVPGAPYELTKTYDLYLINLTPDVHPMHIHLINFQYYKTAKLDVERYQAAWFELNGGEPPYDKNPKHLQPFEYLIDGWVQADEIHRVFKDVVNIQANSVGVFRLRFRHNNGANYGFDARRGRFVWHCHVLEHEDNEMMRYFSVQ